MSWEADLIKVQDGDVVVVPVLLARTLGLSAAAFLRQAAYLSAVVHRKDGWFFLEQEGPGDPTGQTIFARLGSWQSALGLGPDAQASIRRDLRALGLLEETRKGMVHGKLLYRVDAARYLSFLASCGRDSPSICKQRQTGFPVCAIGPTGLDNATKSDCANGESRDDIYQDDSQRKTTTTPAVAGDGGGLSLEEIGERVEAAVWAADPPPRKPGAFRAAVAERLRLAGPTVADAEDLRRYREALAAKAQRTADAAEKASKAAALEAAVTPPELALAKVAKAKRLLAGVSH